MSKHEHSISFTHTNHGKDDKTTQEPHEYASLDNASDRIAFLKLYRDEWEKRDETFRSMFWRFIYLSLIITFLPNVLAAIEVNPEIVEQLPPAAFPIAGIVFSIFGMYYGLAENRRITELDLAYKRVIEAFPEKYLVNKINEVRYRPRLNLMLCYVSYFIIILLALFNLVYYLSVH